MSTRIATSILSSASRASRRRRLSNVKPATDTRRNGAVRTLRLPMGGFGGLTIRATGALGCAFSFCASKWTSRCRQSASRGDYLGTTNAEAVGANATNELCRRKFVRANSASLHIGLGASWTTEILAFSPGSSCFSIRLCHIAKKGVTR